MAKPNSVVIVLGVVVLLVVAVGAYLVLSNRGNANTNPEDTIANAPIGCPKSTSVVVKSDEAGTQHITTSNSNFIQQLADEGRLIFTNYTLNPDSVYSDITQGRVLTVIKLSHQDGTDMTTGTYRKLAKDNSSPNLYSAEYNISTVDLAGGVFDDQASVEITYLGTDYVCGKVTSQDSTSGINGEFIAKYIDKI